MAFECQKDTEVALSKQLGKLAHNSSKEPSLYSKFKGKNSYDLKKPSSLALANGLRTSFKDEDFPSTSDWSSPVQLKNKRPSRLDIPNISLYFGGLAVTPRGPAADSVFEEEGKNGYYSVYCKRGKGRGVMEDRYCASLDLQDNPKQAFFGVYDGHSGCKSAEFAAKNLGKNIMEEVSRNKSNQNETNLQEAIKHGYLKTDSDFLKDARWIMLCNRFDQQRISCGIKRRRLPCCSQQSRYCSSINFRSSPFKTRRERSN